MKIAGVQAAAFQREILGKFEVLEKEVRRSDRGVKPTAINMELQPTMEGTVSPPVAAEGNGAEAEDSRSDGEIRSFEQDYTECRLSDGPWEPSSRRFLYTIKREAGRDTITNGTFRMKSTRLKPQGYSWCINHYRNS